MSSRFMQSTKELCFADPDFLPSYCRKSERRTSYRSNPDSDEAQRLFGTDDDLAYLYTTATRQEETVESDSDDDDLFDDADEGLEEHVVGAFADTDDANCEELHPMRKVTLKVALTVRAEDVITEMNKCFPDWRWAQPWQLKDLKKIAREHCRQDFEGQCWYETQYVPAKPPLEPVDPEEAAERRQLDVEANKAIVYYLECGSHAKAGCNSKPRRISDNRQTLRHADLAERDSLEERRIARLFTEIETERKSAKKVRHLVAA